MLRLSSFTTLLLFALLLTIVLSPADAQCPNRCISSRRRASNQCRRGRRRRRLCDVTVCRRRRVCRRVRCRRNRRRRCRRCFVRRWYSCSRDSSGPPRPNPDPRPPIFPPRPRPIPGPTCGTRCSRRYRFFSCPKPCVKVRCGRRWRRTFRCLPIIPVPPPPPFDPTPPKRESPTPFPSPPPFPDGAVIPADVFKKRTITKCTGEKSSITTGGGRYKVNYDITCNTKGIVQFDRLKNSVNIVCSPDGSVRIRTSAAQAAKLTLSEMLPIGSTLVISHKSFGKCVLTRPPTSPGTNSATRILQDFQNQDISSGDAYLVISSVIGTAEDATVRGTIASYMSLYSSANIKLTPTNPGGATRVSVAKSSGGITTSGSLTNGIKLKSISLIIAGGSVSGSIVYDSKPKLNIDSSSGLPTASGRTLVTLVDELGSIPLLNTIGALPPLTLSNRLLVTAEVESEIAGGLSGTGIGSNPTVKTANVLEPASEEVTVTLSGSAARPTVRETRTKLSPPRNVVKITPSITQGAVPASARMLAETMAMEIVSRQTVAIQGAIRIRFVLCGSTFIDGISRAWCYSFTFTVAVATNTSPAFPPQVGQFGDCSVCHLVQFTTSIAGTCFSYDSAFLGTPVNINSIPLSFIFAQETGCFAPAPAAINCGGACCNTGETCTADTCTTPPVPSTVARQLLRVCEGDDCEDGGLSNQKEFFTM